MPKEETAAGWKLVMVLPRRRQRSRRRVWASSWTWSGASSGGDAAVRGLEDASTPVSARPPWPACPRPARLWQVSPLSPWLASLRPPRHRVIWPASPYLWPAFACQPKSPRDAASETKSSGHTNGETKPRQLAATSTGEYTLAVAASPSFQYTLSSACACSVRPLFVK